MKMEGDTVELFDRKFKIVKDVEGSLNVCADCAIYKECKKLGLACLCERFGGGWHCHFEEEPWTEEDIGDFVERLRTQFPEISFAKLSRIVVRTYNFVKRINRC